MKCKHCGYVHKTTFLPEESERLHKMMGGEGVAMVGATIACKKSWDKQSNKGTLADIESKLLEELIHKIHVKTLYFVSYKDGEYSMSQENYNKWSDDMEELLIKAFKQIKQETT